jgi:hypothetical protein
MTMPIDHLQKPSVIPDRLFRILESCQGNNGNHCFPQTEIFNEGWMLRLVLDAFYQLKISNYYLTFLDGEARWFSEARLISPFLPRSKKDPLGESHTHADGVIGHFKFRPGNKAGIELKNKARQFVVVEAKLLSNLSKGVEHALEYNQAARYIACMVETFRRSRINVDELKSVGFFLIAPKDKLIKFEKYLCKESVKKVIAKRLEGYYGKFPDSRAPFVQSLDSVLEKIQVKALSWEEAISRIQTADQQIGKALNDFYKHCFVHASPKRIGLV